MKKLFVILLTGLILVSGSFAAEKYSPEYLKMARKNLLWALESENEGVRSDAIFIILKFKAGYPDENFKPFIEKLKKMCQKDDCLKNRLQAYLARTFLEEKGLEQQINPQKFEDAKIFFADLYQVLNAKQLAME